MKRLKDGQVSLLKRNNYKISIQGKMQILKVSNWLWSIVLALLIILSLFYAYISYDAPYYLSIARDISNGFIPYKDISSLYAPLMMYLNSFLYFFIEDPNYKYFLIFQYVIIFFSAVLLYIIGLKSRLGKQKSFFLSLFLFLIVLSSEGTYINLEVYILLCVMLSFWFLLRKNYFWVGIFISLTVFFKQYGVFNFVPFILLVSFYHGYKKKNLFLFSLGASVPFILFFIYYVVLNNVPLLDLLDQLSGRGYGQKNISRSRSLFTWLLGSKEFLLLLIPLFFLKIKPFKDIISGVLFLGIIVNLIPVLVQVFPHYFILTFPYVFMLMILNGKDINKNFLSISNMVLVVTCIFLFLRILRYKNIHEEQVNIAEKMKKIYPKGSEVFLEGKIRYLYILNDYRNPVLKEVGYDYGFTPDEEFREKYWVLSMKSYSSEGENRHRN